jgi:prolyl oligopeptidase
MPLTLNPPPPTPVEPVTEMLHGVPVTDPYRWLEDQTSPRTRKWIGEQTTYARGYLDAIPGRERVRNRVKELLAVEVVSEPWKVGNRYFFLKRVAHQERPVIMMREGEAGEDIPLADPAERDAEGTLTVGILNISNDGRHLAYSVRCGGEDTCAVEFFDVNREVTLPDRLPRGLWRGLAFSPDGSGFYYSHEPLGSLNLHSPSVSWHTFGTDPNQDSEIFSLDQNPKHSIVLLGSGDGLCLCYLVISLEDSRTIDLWIHAIANGTPPQRILERVEGLFSPMFAGGKLIALTDWKSPNGRIVSIDQDHSQRDEWHDIVPETEARIQGFAIAGRLIFVSLIENALARIETFDFSGRPCGTLPSPPRGTLRILPSRPDSDTLFYSFSSFSHPPAILRYNVGTRQQDVWAQCQVPFDPACIEVDRVEYVSKDGTRVPMFLVAQRGWKRLGSLPTFLTGYGGFGVSLTPQFTAYATFLMEQGFLFAVANLRGGSEFGEQWHLAGKRHNRQNAIDDFIAAAEWLLKEKYAARNRIGIGGGSNAGLLVGAALTQRPDLFRAVVCLGPLLDMLRYHKFDQANLWVDEFGSADNQDDFHSLQAYSPYHHVEDGAAYPAVMLISGDADMRCNPLHTRKMAARLQAATSSDHPILLDYKPVWGHTPVQPLSNRIETLTDRLTFICHELGVSL